MNTLSQKSLSESTGLSHISILDQKSSLKISILNKLTAKFLIGHFLIKNLDKKSKEVVELLQVLKLVEDELFGDAYYDLNYRRNVTLRKPIHPPNDDDVKMLLDECSTNMNSLNDFDLLSYL